MEKKLISPYLPNAFSPEIMHKVVLNSIDFKLPDQIWSVIDEAFAHYWNDEVGYGNWVDIDSAVNAMQRALERNHIIFSFDKVVQIAEIMFDWIKKVPGAFLDDDNSSQKETISFDDTQTDFVYISDKLKEFYPGTYKRLTKLFDEMSIEWSEVKNTKDIWIRDYMPIQLDKNSFVVYDYNPNYLQNEEARYKTDSHKAYKGYLSDVYFKDASFKLDGGNYVKCGDYAVLTSKVFIENGYPDDEDYDFYCKLCDAFDCELIILPWQPDNLKTPEADVYGHSDGIIKWTGGNNILMSNRRESNSREADRIKHYLNKKGFHVTEMLFEVNKPNPIYNWAYINYLQVGNKIIMPIFGIQEDKQAFKYIQEANPHCEIRTIRLRDIASLGGALHCITWNIQKPNSFFHKG